jgi:hypothetical protein
LVGESKVQRDPKRAQSSAGLLAAGPVNFEFLNTQTDRLLEIENLFCVEN